jgi:transposase
VLVARCEALKHEEHITMSRNAATAVVHAIGVDTGKNTLHLIGLDDQGAIVLREKVSRSRIAARLANVPQCLIGIEAGMATHYVARELIALGHDVKQVPQRRDLTPVLHRLQPWNVR